MAVVTRLRPLEQPREMPVSRIDVTPHPRQYLLGGVVIAAMIIGLLERLVGGYFFVNYASALPFIFMIIAIAIRPQGLFGAREHASRL